MINKQNLWFVTLFSIILVLSIFYISMNESNIKAFIAEEPNTEDTTLVINESTELVALRVESNEETLEAMNNLKNIILSETTNADEKNEAYESLLELSNNKGTEEKIEGIIKKEFNLDAFVKIKNNDINIVIDSSNHDYELANKIIRKTQEQFDVQKYITVKFN